MVLMCDFNGNQKPEIVKRRPVVVITPNRIYRPGLVTVVPLSTTAPDPITDYHYRLAGNPIPGETKEVWAKCDLVTTVRFERLDRISVGRKYSTGQINGDQVRAIRVSAAKSFGIEFDGN